MRIYTNELHIRRFARIGQVTSIGGMVVMVAGFAISLFREDLIVISLACLVVGFILAQIGIFLGNRYARVPRPDQAINQALKGLDKQHRLYHYVAPNAHLLSGPSGLWVLVPKPQRGRITYEKGRWRQHGGLFLSYLRLFAQEGIGRPEVEIGAEVDALKKFLGKEIPDVEFPEPTAALLFTNERAEVDAENAPVATLPISYLKGYIRKQAKEKATRMTPVQIEALAEKLEAGFKEGEAEEAED